MNLKKSFLLMATFCCGVSSSNATGWLKGIGETAGRVSAHAACEMGLLWGIRLGNIYLSSGTLAGGSCGLVYGYLKGKAFGDSCSSGFLNNHSTLVAGISALLSGGIAAYGMRGEMELNHLGTDVLRTAAFWTNSKSSLSLPAAIAASYGSRNLQTGIPICGFAVAYWALKKFLSVQEYSALGGAAAIAGVVWGLTRFAKKHNWLIKDHSYSEISAHA
jgi:hypothetical protein